MLIAFTGRAGAGKSECANYLQRTMLFHRVRFADPLKDMLRALGLTFAEVDGNMKEQPCELLGGRTPRHAMQTLGTEWGRNLIHPDLWTKIWAERANYLLSEGHKVVADDLRFPNEAEAVRALGGKIIRVQSPNSFGVPDHESERNEIQFDASIYNEGLDLSVLRSRIEGALQMLSVEA